MKEDDDAATPHEIGNQHACTFPTRYIILVLLVKGNEKENSI